LSEAKEQKTLREKLREKREQRELSEKILKSKGLASSDEEDNEDSAAAWLEKVKQKQEAMKKAKLLEEMDEQFGVDELIETAKRPKTNASQNYDSKNLKGIYFLIFYNMNMNSKFLGTVTGINKFRRFII
jgi:U4/U6.U5 tri-snRNP-associated protein 1